MLVENKQRLNVHKMNHRIIALKTYYNQIIHDWIDLFNRQKKIL